MSREFVSRIVVQCDRCGTIDAADGGDYYYERPHYIDTQDVAERGGFTHTADGLDVCADCANKAACVERGHDWGVWRFLIVNGAPAGDFRECTRCHAQERREHQCAAGGVVHAATTGSGAPRPLDNSLSLFWVTR